MYRPGDSGCYDFPKNVQGRNVVNQSDEGPEGSENRAINWTAYVSFALVALTAAAAVRDASVLGSNGNLLDRLFGALLALGAIGSALHVFRWRGSPLLRLIAHPGFAWPAAAVGAAYGILS